MKVGVVTEIKPDEYRVALTPAGVLELVSHGHEVIVEATAVKAAPYPTTITAPSARGIVATDQVWAESEMVLKVKEPLTAGQSAPPVRRSSRTCILRPAPELTRRLIERRRHLHRLRDGRRRVTAPPLLAPMSEVAGRLSVQVGALYLEKTLGGRGMLLGGVPGVLPAKVRGTRRRHRRLQRCPDRPGHEVRT